MKNNSKPKKVIFQDTIKKILLTNSYSNNINCIDKNFPSRSLKILKDYVSQNQRGFYDILLSIKKDILHLESPLFSLAVLCSVKADYSILLRVFDFFIDDIIKVIRFVETLSHQSINFKIRGPIKKILKERLSELDEDDIALYFSEPEFTFKITLRKLIEALKPKFKDPDIKTALNWLYKNKYDRTIFQNKYKKLATIEDVINKSIPDDFEEIIKRFKGIECSVLPHLFAINHSLTAKAIEELGGINILNKPFYLIPLFIGYKIPFFLAAINPFLAIAFPLLLFSGIELSKASTRNKIKDYIPTFMRKGSTAFFIDISGSNLYEYRTDSSAGSIENGSRLEQAITFFSFLSSGQKHKELLSFTQKVEKCIWHHDRKITIKNILKYKRYNLGNINAPFDWIVSQKKKYDNIFIFTNHAFSNLSKLLWEKYKKDVYPNAKLFLIQYVPVNFKTISLPNDYYRIIGWNESSIQNIQNIIKYL